MNLRRLALPLLLLSLAAPGPVRAARTPRALSAPDGLAVGPGGRVYVTDIVKRHVLVFTPGGRLLQTLGSFRTPEGVAVGTGGTVYVADAGAGRVEKLAPNGRVLASWGGRGNRLLFQPSAVAVDGRGNVYVADGQDSWVEKLSTAGKHLGQLGNFGNPGQGAFIGPSALAVDSAGNLYVADYGWVTELGPSGNERRTWGRLPDGYGTLGFAQGLASGPGEDVYVTDVNRGQVARLLPNGHIAVWKRGLLRPIGIVVANGRVYVAESGRHRIDVFTIAGRLLARWG